MSEAEKRETVAERAWREHPNEMARAHTEFEVADLKARLAETEAIIGTGPHAEDCRCAQPQDDTGVCDCWKSSHRPSVLEAHDREVAARAFDGAKGAIYALVADPAVYTTGAVRAVVGALTRLEEYAVSYRSGSEGNEQ